MSDYILEVTIIQHNTAPSGKVIWTKTIRAND